MTVEQIIAALQAIIDEAQASVAASADPNAEPVLTEEQAKRYEELEAQLLVARKSEEILKRNALHKLAVGPVASGIQVTERIDAATRNFDQFLRSGGKVDPDLVARAQSEASGPAGGYFVPDTFRDKLIEKQKAFGGLMAAAENITTATGAPLIWMTNDDVLDTEAGIVAEGAANTFGADFVFGRNALNAFKYDTAGATASSGNDTAKWLRVSWELLQDSNYDLQPFIARKFAERIQRKLAKDLINGSGVNEPVGIISTAGGLTDSGVTIASATAGPTYAELVTIEHSLDIAYRDNAKWLMNDRTLSLIEQLVDLNGRPLIWNSGAALGDSKAQKSLLGYPVVVDNAMPDLLTGSTRGLVFGDLQQAYVVRTVKDFTLVVANELFAGTGQVGFLGWGRYDGMVQDANAAVYVTSHS